MRIFVGNEPRAYREVIAAALQSLRPVHAVTVVDPDDVDCMIARLKPDLVICSRLSPLVETGPVSWIVLYPGLQSKAVISLAGRRVEEIHVDFPRLLGAIDETETVLQRFEAEPGGETSDFGAPVRLTLSRPI